MDHWVIHTPGSKKPPVGRIGKGTDECVLRLNGANFPSCGWLPQANRAIRSCRGQSPTVGRISYLLDVAAMSPEGKRLLTRADFAKMNHPFSFMTVGQELAIR